MTSLKRQFVEGVFYFSSGSLIVTLLHFFSTVIIIRSLGLLEYGLFVLALSFYTILASFLECGIGGVVLADSSAAIGEKDYTKAKTLLKSYMKFEFVMGSTLFLVALILSFMLSGLYDNVIGRLLLIIAFYLFTTSLQNAVSIVFYSLSKFKIFNLIHVAEALMRFALVVVFIFLMSKGILVAMMIYVVAQLTGILLVIPSLLGVRNKLKPYPLSNKPLFKDAIKDHGKWAVFSLPIKRIGGQIHYWIVEYFLGVNSVALLGVAMRGTDILKIFLQSFERVLMPITANIVKNWEKTKYLMNKSIKYNLWISVVVAVPAIVFAPYLIEIVFSGKYLEAVPIFRVLLLTLIPASLVVIRPLFYALRAQKYLFYSDVIIDALIIFFDFVFIWVFGLIGVGVSMFLIAFLVFLIRVGFLRKFKPDFIIRVRDLFTIDDFDKKQLKLIMTKVKSKLLNCYVL